MRVELSSLHATSSLKPRGQTDAVDIVTTESGCTHVFKSYKDETRSHLRPDVLLELTSWRAQLDSSDRSWLDSHGAWVRHVVYDHGEVVGVLVPIAPSKCWTMMGTQPAPRAGSRLLLARNKAEHFNHSHRLRLMGKLLEAILWFHERDVVIGDIQLENFLVAGDNQIYVIDLDSAWLHGRCPVPLTQNERYGATFDFGIQTQRTDLYKFALVCTKVLALDGSAKSASFSAHAMAGYQSDLMESLLEGRVEDASTIASLARAWSKCVRDEKETIFVPGAVSRIGSTEAPGHLVAAIPPAVDRCVGVSVRSRTVTPTQSTPSIRRVPVVVRTPVPVRKRPHTGVVVLIFVGLVVLAFIVYLVGFVR